MGSRGVAPVNPFSSNSRSWYLKVPLAIQAAWAEGTATTRRDKKQTQAWMRPEMRIFIFPREPAKICPLYTCSSRLGQHNFLENLCCWRIIPRPRLTPFGSIHYNPVNLDSDAGWSSL